MTNRASPLLCGVLSSVGGTFTPTATTHYTSEHEYCLHAAQHPWAAPHRPARVLQPRALPRRCCPLLAALGTQASGELGKAGQARMLCAKEG